MTDPLDALRLPPTPADPDPRFAAELRARIERALLRGGTMSETTTAAPALGDVGYASLWLPDAERATAFYHAVLGWETVAGDTPGERSVPGRTPPLGIWPTTEANTMFMAHTVDDVAAAVRRVRAAGGQATDPVDQPYGRMSDCVDNQGMRCALFQPRSAGRARPEAGYGDLAYLTVEVPESALFREFYGAVFGWTFTPGRINDGWGVNEVRPMMGMHGGAARPAVLPMYRVADIAATVAAVRAHGGTAADPAQRPYGQESLCADDQGSRFYLGQL